MRELFKKHIAIPQDHGSWIFILSPLLIGLFAGDAFTYATLSLIISAMSAFMIRQPMTIFVKVVSGRRPKADLPPALFWLLIYGFSTSLALTFLIVQGFVYVLYLAIPGVPVFVWHLWLVSKRNERKIIGIEVLATGILSLAAPAAYWVSLGEYNSTGWVLWACTWLQTAASIVYAYLRLEQRELNAQPANREMWRMGQRSLVYTSSNLFIALVLSWGNIVPQLIFIPFLLQWVETIWGITHPSIGWKPAHIGVRQLIISTLWTILFIIFWKA
jgi:hypothetical protein